jgi:hypothetical protein
MGQTIGRMEDFFTDGDAVDSNTPFIPSARYYEPMDCIVYVEEDTSHRSDRVDRFLTLLWHPYEERAIGVKLKGFRFIFERTRQILEAQGVPISESEFVPLITAFEVATTAGLGNALMTSAERERLDEKYKKARDLIKNVCFDARELMKAA